MKEKTNREQRDSVQKTMSEEEKEKCLSDMSRVKRSGVLLQWYTMYTFDIYYDVECRK